MQVAYCGVAEQVRALLGQLDEAKRIHQIDMQDAEWQLQTSSQPRQKWNDCSRRSLQPNAREVNRWPLDMKRR